ncbi:NAD-dependent epimerase/dehydratase family protein [bacterium]|nr:NAD-dependent epimerase/dehydratase family protein [bacterium]
MKKILVTGGSGFTGGHLCRRLAGSGCDVRTLVLPGQDVSSLETAGVTIIRGDLVRRETLDEAVRGVDTVYHIAAVYHEENIPRQLFWDVNVAGTRNMLEVSRAAGVRRFVHCSTVGVQGEIAHPPATEEAPYRPGDYYQQSKMEGELAALEFARKGMPVVVFRPVGIYGPGDKRFLKLFRHIQSGRFRMIGSGKVLYHLTYIDDLVEGILLTGTVPGIEGEVFTLAGGEYVTLNELVRIIAEILGVKISKLHIPVWPVWTAGALCELACRPLRLSPPLYRRRVDFFIKDRAFDIGKARKHLGYQPRVDLRTGLANTAEWYSKQGFLK